MYSNLFGFNYLFNVWSYIILWLTIIVIIYKFLVYSKDVLRKFCSIKPEGKAVLITGCDSGFGNQLAIRLNGLGFRVYATVLDPNFDGSKSLTKLCRFKDQMVVLKMDVTRDDDIRDVYQKIRTDLKKTDCILWSVVNNAGFGVLAQTEWLEMEQFKRLFDVNLFGLVQVTKTFLGLIKNSKGRIVNLSSILGLRTMNGYGAYSMTKYGVTAFSEALRTEMIKFNVKVCTIHPSGFKNTNFIPTTINSANRVWDQLDGDVKNEYGGQQYYNNWINKHIYYLKLSQEDTGQVVDAILDAITNCYPKNSYHVFGFALTCGHFMINTFVPTFLLDYLTNF